MGLTRITSDGITDATIDTEDIGNLVITNAKVATNAAIARTKLANVDVVDDTSPQLGGSLNSNGNNILFADSNGSNNMLKVGSGDDLKIYHQSNSSYIVNQTGNLNIASSTAVRIRGGSDVAESMAIFNDNGSVELYFDNSKKLETTSYGILSAAQVRVASSNATTVGFSLGDVGTGFYNSGSNAIGYSANGTQKWNINSSGSLTLFDNVNINIGTSSDLQIFHDSNNSYIKDTGSGGLFIQGSGGGAGITLEDPDGNDFIKCIDEGTGGTVELYKAGTKRFHTTTSGVAVTGIVEIADGSVSAPALAFTDDLDTGIFSVSQNTINFTTAGVERLEMGTSLTVFNDDGADVDFRVEGDTQASLLKVDAGNDRVGIGESDPSTVFQVTQFNHAFADSTSSLATVPTKSVARFRGSNNASGSLFIGNESSNARCYLQGCNDTGNGSIDLLLNPFGANVGIGTTSPATKLHINGGTYAAPTGGNDGFTQLVISNQSAGQGAGIGLLGAGNMVTFIHFGDSDDANVGAIVYNNVVDSMQFYVNASQRMNIDSSGNVNINSDSGKLTIGVHADLQLFHNGSNSYIQDNGTGGLYIGSNGGNVYIRGQHGEESIIANSHGSVELYHDDVKKMETTSVGVTMSDTVITNGEIRPASDNNHSIGRSNRRYITYFGVNGSINTSDKNEKNTIIDSDLGLDFINKLKPISFKWNKDDGKTHYGLIAQDLEETLTSLGKTIADFGGIYKEDDSPMGLGYSELIAPLIKAVQELSAEVAALKTS